MMKFQWQSDSRYLPSCQGTKKKKIIIKLSKIIKLNYLFNPDVKAKMMFHKYSSTCSHLIHLGKFIICDPAPRLASAAGVTSR